MVMDIVWFLLIGLVAGWLASLITKREGKGIAQADGARFHALQ
jgi:uncharacterized membrane protein YeaQ/YmgE (transglycosylase-associated protein family)